MELGNQPFIDIWGQLLNNALNLVTLNHSNGVNEYSLVRIF